MDRLATRLEQQTRYVISAPLAAGKRALDLGGAALEGPALLAAEATEVVVVSSHVGSMQTALQATEAPLGNLVLQEETSLPLPFADGYFDLAICHDLPERLHTDERWLSELRRVLGPQGYLMTCVANAGGSFLGALAGRTYASSVDYATLYTQISSQFAAVSVFAQAPVVASLFYDVEDDSDGPGLLFDRSLLLDEDETPGWLILVFGPQAYRRSDLAIVQLPFGSVVEELTRDFSARHGVAQTSTAALPQKHQVPPTQVDLIALQQSLTQSEEQLARERAGATHLQGALRDAEQQMRATSAARVVAEAHFAALLAQQRQLIERANTAARHAQERLSAAQADTERRLHGMEEQVALRLQESDAQARVTVDSLQAELGAATARNRELEHQLQTHNLAAQHEAVRTLEENVRQCQAARAAAERRAQQLGQRLSEHEALAQENAAGQQHALNVALERAEALAARVVELEAAHGIPAVSHLPIEPGDVPTQVGPIPEGVLGKSPSRAAVEDAVGRPVESAAEGLEDLLTTSIPSTSTKG